MLCAFVVSLTGTRLILLSSHAPIANSSFATFISRYDGTGMLTISGQIGNIFVANSIN